LWPLDLKRIRVNYVFLCEESGRQSGEECEDAKGKWELENGGENPCVAEPPEAFSHFRMIDTTKSKGQEESKRRDHSLVTFRGAQKGRRGEEDEKKSSAIGEIKKKSTSLCDYLEGTFYGCAMLGER